MVVSTSTKEVIKEVVVEGSLIFANANIVFEAEWIDIRPGGRWIIGNEDDPISKDNTIDIVLHG